MIDQNQSPIPDKFACIIGGYLRPSYAVEMDGTGCLIYKAMGKEYKIRETKKISPDTKRWNDFWESCDHVIFGTGPKGMRIRKFWMAIIG